MVMGGFPWKRKECGKIKNKIAKKAYRGKKTKHVRMNTNFIDCFKSLFVFTLLLSTLWIPSSTKEK